MSSIQWHYFSLYGKPLNLSNVPKSSYNFSRVFQKALNKNILIYPSNHYRLSFFNTYYVVQNNFQQTWEARRERLKSALYLRLKKRKFEIYVRRFHEKLLFSDLRLLLTKTQYSSDIALNSGYYDGDLNKIEGMRPFEDKTVFEKSLTATRKVERGTL